METLVTWSGDIRSVIKKSGQHEHESMQKQHTLVVHAKLPNRYCQYRFLNLATLGPQDYLVEYVGRSFLAKSQRQVSLLSKARLLGKLAQPPCENYTPCFDIISLPA